MCVLGQKRMESIAGVKPFPLVKMGKMIGLLIKTQLQDPHNRLLRITQKWYGYDEVSELSNYIIKLKIYLHFNANFLKYGKFYAKNGGHVSMFVVNICTALASNAIWSLPFLVCVNLKVSD